MTAPETGVERQRSQSENSTTRKRRPNRAITRRGVLKTSGLLTAVGLGVGTATATPQGQVGVEDRPLEVLYTEKLNGGVTDSQSVTALAGEGLSVDGSGTLTATAARLDVEDGTTTVSTVEEISFGGGLRVTDDGDGTVSIDR